MPHASREVVVLNEQGLHARPSMKFVDVANGFPACEVTLTRLVGPDGEPEETVDGKSIMSLLTVIGGKGTPYRIDADGDDAEAAVAALAKLFEDKFEEE